MSIESNHYHPSFKLIHWLMAALIIGLLALGIYMEDLPKGDFKYELYAWHKSFGVLVIGLLALRVMLRVTTRIPAIPERFMWWEKLLAKLVHLLLYVAMVAIPLSGYIMSDAGDYGVKFFGVVLPDFIVKNKEIGEIAHEIHELAPFMFILIALHVAGALKHKFFDAVGDDVMVRMLPKCPTYCSPKSDDEDVAS